MHRTICFFIGLANEKQTFKTTHTTFGVQSQELVQHAMCDVTDPMAATRMTPKCDFGMPFSLALQK